MKLVFGGTVVLYVTKESVALERMKNTEWKWNINKERVLK